MPNLLTSDQQEVEFEGVNIELGLSPDDLELPNALQPVLDQPPPPPVVSESTSAASPAPLPSPALIPDPIPASRPPLQMPPAANP